MRLELDAGNSRIKWRLWEARGRFAGGDDLRSALVLVPKWLPFVEEVWVSSVQQETADWIASIFPQSQFAISALTKNGLINGYDKPETLGVDRWLAMLAAWTNRPHESHVVVDAGTALTVDVIDGSGQHIGGYICPGFRLMKAGLLTGTQQVKPEAQWLGGRLPGHDTQQCVDYGIRDMVLCWVEQQCLRYPASNVTLTGGDSLRILQSLSFTVNHQPDLVLDGLQVSFLK